MVLRLVTTAILLTVATLALAARPPGLPISADADWWSGAVTREGDSCCGQADGHIVAARQLGAVWQIWLEGHWENVPGEAVLLHYPPHPAGSATAWMFGSKILCFSPPKAGG